MADVKFEIVRYALSEQGGPNPTQDITIPGFGTPKAAIFLVSGGITNDNIRSNVFLGIGFTDGNRSVCNFNTYRDTSGTSATSRRERSNAVIITMLAGSVSEDSRYSFDSWITDGVRLSIDVSGPNAAYLVTCILIGGDDVSDVYADFHDDLGTGTNPVNITAPGFTPDLLFLSTINLSGGAPDNSNTVSYVSFGVGINDGNDTQRVMMSQGDNGTGFANAGAYIGNTSIVGAAFSAGGLSWDAVAAYIANGFSLNPNSSTSSSNVIYLSIKFNNSPGLSLFDLSWPTSGNYIETTPGFQPNFGFIVSMSGATARNNNQTSGIFGFSLATFDDSVIHTINGTYEDNAFTTVAKSIISDRLRIRKWDHSANEVIASSYAFTNVGWDFPLTTNPSPALLGWGLAIGIEEGDGVIEKVRLGTEAIEAVKLGTIDSDAIFLGTLPIFPTPPPPPPLPVIITSFSDSYVIGPVIYDFTSLFPEAGDQLLAFSCWDVGTTGFTTPPGWTLIWTSDPVTSVPVVYAYSKISDGTEGIVTIGGSETVTAVCSCAIRVSGPLLYSSIEHTSATTGRPNPPPNVAQLAGELIIVVGMMEDDEVLLDYPGTEDDQLCRVTITAPGDVSCMTIYTETTSVNAFNPPTFTSTPPQSDDGNWGATVRMVTP